MKKLFIARVGLATLPLFLVACSSSPHWETVSELDKATGNTQTFVALKDAPVLISYDPNGEWAKFHPFERIKRDFSSVNYGCTFSVRAEGEEVQYIGAICTEDGGAFPIGYPGAPDLGIPAGGTTPPQFVDILRRLGGKKVFIGFPTIEGPRVIEMTMPAMPASA